MSTASNRENTAIRFRIVVLPYKFPTPNARTDGHEPERAHESLLSQT
jgi:hypothetical protein